jgi:hypothetical protein
MSRAIAWVGFAAPLLARRRSPTLLSGSRACVRPRRGLDRGDLADLEVVGSPVGDRDQAGFDHLEGGEPGADLVDAAQVVGDPISAWALAAMRTASLVSAASHRAR